MLEPHLLPRQPSTALSFWNVGRLLYCSSILFLFESLIYWEKFRDTYRGDSVVLSIFWFGCVIFAFSHIFLVILDGWSRFQNYKRIKDNLFTHGFSSKIARLYIGSKCQRNAFLVAARELGMEDQAVRYYRRQGIKPYHLIPHYMIQDRCFLFKRFFWSRTFLEKYYEPKFNYRALKQQIYL
jgi:hypothetical protein